MLSANEGQGIKYSTGNWNTFLAQRKDCTTRTLPAAIQGVTFWTLVLPQLPILPRTILRRTNKDILVLVWQVNQMMSSQVGSGNTRAPVITAVVAGTLENLLVGMLVVSVFFMCHIRERH